MKSIYMITGIIFCTIILWTGMGTASTIVGDSLDLTEYLKTATDQPPGNKIDKDNEYNVNALVDLYNTDPDNFFDLPENLTLLGKWEDGDWNSWNDETFSEFTGTFTGNEGAWNVSDDWDATVPLYYSLKAGSTKSGGGFELWYTDGVTNGAWNTFGLDSKDLSHISFWKADGKVDPPTNPVPEPGTMALLGIGLATVAGYRRKRSCR
ncbi:MAG: PEP-CTERM sorting domain-containing protein [Desulfotignum sp.]|nr:PEP-CTERM sorting domain-containing protein [Desulfotignum sp.]MCF8124744.1 PEP-CTERM sorting domain-containing protein [Desulfotignum sp.]